MNINPLYKYNIHENAHTRSLQSFTRGGRKTEKAGRLHFIAASSMSAYSSSYKTLHNKRPYPREAEGLQL